MKRYDTPIEVATVLAKHAPKRITSLLEPSVGQGILLEPLLIRSKGYLKKVVCIDIDANILKQVKNKFKPLLGKVLNVLHTDFLEWSLFAICKKRMRFDCIVMNPPFSGRIKDLVRLDLAEEFPGLGKGCRAVPIEVAFIVRALRLLDHGGTLLAVVPATLVSSLRTSWLRLYLMKLGAVDYVHELPKRTFKGVEARVYLFVYKKSAKQKNIIVCNHELIEPVKLIISKDDLNSEIRFDYSFHYAQKWYKRFMTSFPNLEWTKLDDIAFVYRGRVESPFGARNALHTCDYRNGFWHSENRYKHVLKDTSEEGIRSGDLLVKRVGRWCVQSIGKIVGHEKCACSDCLLIIRPKRMEMSSKLLFSLRVLLSAHEGSHLMERGTGATYMSEGDLRKLFVPIGLFRENPIIYTNYQHAIACMQINFMKEIEYQVRQIYGMMDTYA